MTKTTQYKNTVIGPIPIDWEVKKLGEFTKITAGGTPSTTKSSYWGGNIKWMNSGELNYKFIYDVEGRITEDGLRNSSTKLIPPHCILIGLAGQGKTRGTVAMNMVELCTNQSIASIYPSCNFKEEFLYFNLDSRYNEIRLLSTGDGGRGGLNLSILNNLHIPLPPLPEQQKIAKILSTWDKAIQETEAIIKKLEDRNKALAFSLLTGKKRVEGFEKKEFKKSSAKEIFKSISIKNNPEDSVLLSATQEFGMIPRDMIESRVTMPSGSLKTYKLVNKGNFVISLRSFQGGIEYSEYTGVVSPAYTVLKSMNTINDDFYKYYFKSEDLISRLSVAVIGIRDGKNISYEDFSTIVLPNPSLEEQNAIAEILNTANKEVKQYQQKLEALKLQKKGLMQQLLTGKIRTI